MFYIYSMGCVYIVAVLTHCEVHCINAVLYVCYVRARSVDTATLMAFRNLRQSASLADIIVVSNQISRRSFVFLWKDFSQMTCYHYMLSGTLNSTHSLTRVCRCFSVCCDDSTSSRKLKEATVVRCSVSGYYWL